MFVCFLISSFCFFIVYNDNQEKRRYIDRLEIINYNLNNRIERLENAFNSALKRCLTMLENAEAGNYDVFLDRWNCDVGRSDSPISNLTVEIKTAENTFTNFGKGTDDYVYFGIELKDGSKKEWQLDNGKASGVTVNDFEAGNNDKFYLYIDRFSSNISPESIQKIYIRKEEEFLLMKFIVFWEVFIK